VIDDAINFYINGVVYTEDNPNIDYPIEYFDGFDLKDFGDK